MAITITTVSTGLLEIQLNSSTANTKWFPYLSLQESPSDPVIITDATGFASATYSGGNLEWGVTQAQTIYVSALQDTGIIYFSALNTSDSSVASGNPLIPYQSKIQFLTASSTVLSAYITGFYEQVSSQNILPFLTSDIIRWHFTPTNQAISGNLSGGPIYKTNIYPTISGYAPSASLITYGYKGTSNNIAGTITVENVNKYHPNNSPLSISLTNPFLSYKFNPSTEFYAQSSTPSSVTLLVVQNQNAILPGQSLVWFATPTTGLYALTGDTLSNDYTFGDIGDSGDLKRIKLSATDLSQKFNYSLSSQTSITSAFFRPYAETTIYTIPTVSATLVKTEDNVYTYSLVGLGFDTFKEITHNLERLQYVYWENDSTNINAFVAEDNAVYNFRSTGAADYIDRINIEITAPIVQRPPTITTAPFVFVLLSGGNINSGEIGRHEFSIEYSEFLDAEYFNPKFRFQYEPEGQTEIYRPITTAVYTISNTSVLPENSYGFIEFKFDTAKYVLPYDTRTNDIPSTVTHYFDGSISPTICTISMTVSAFGVGYTDYFVRSAPSKTITFTDVPNASSFIIYPQYRWNGAIWEEVVSGYPNGANISIIDAHLSAYGFCHTENFLLSNADNTGSSYKWVIKDTLNNTTTQTVVSATTAWLSFKTPLNTTSLLVCASIYPPNFPLDAPPIYYDTPAGEKFINFSSTNEPITSAHRQNIKIVGADNIGINPAISAIKHIHFAAPNIISITGSYQELQDTAPFTLYIPAFYFNLSSIFWKESESILDPVSGTAIGSFTINVDDIGDSYLGVPLNESTQIKITPGINFTPNLKVAHPLNNDWCLDSTELTNPTNAVTITAYPMTPIIYTSNRHVITGQEVKFDNLVQCFSGSNSGPTNFVWLDRNDSINITTCAPYTTTYNLEGNYSIILRNIYNFGGSSKSLQNTFNGAVVVDSQRELFNPNITRIFGTTQLKLPHSLEDCSMAPNEWVVEDTFNATLEKLYDNLTYLENMSQLYDLPPTDYVGWYGTIYYNNNVPRTRWYTNMPQNSYAYDHPEFSIDYTFKDIQSLYVRNNIMYVSDSTSISILSGDIYGTLISKRPYKTPGDDFTNARAIELDSEGRIYVLDTFKGTSGSKNRVLVFSYNFSTSVWTLLYEWGGLGGPTAKTKFKNPSDLHVDRNDILWVADTDNNCVKKYTRTGSWLNTLISSQFSETEQPLSITSDERDYLFVLTNSKVVVFDPDDNHVATYGIPPGAQKVDDCQDGGFIYITYKDKVFKFASFGANSGTIAENDFEEYSKDYRDSFQDEYRNLYIASSNHILKYIDKLSIISLRTPAKVKWTLDELQVDKDEYIQDWVVNRCYQRLWDNLELFRRSLLGKFGYQTFTNTTKTTFISTLPQPPNFNYCDFDWLYENGVRVTKDLVFTYEKPVVRTFKPNEYKHLPYDKNSIFIGINELNAAAVYNRVIKKLHECEQTLLQMIND